MANPQALNRMSYVYNNPINYVDPTGHFAEKDDRGGECTATSTDYLPSCLIDGATPKIVKLEEVIAKDYDDDYLNDDGSKGLDFDGFGFRFDVTAEEFIGVDGNIDIIFLFDSWSVDIVFSPGIEVGPEAGAAASAGLLLLFNTASTSEYSGASQTFGGDIVLGVGIEAEWSTSYTEGEKGYPQALYLGGAGGAQVGIHETTSYGYSFVNDLPKILDLADKIVDCGFDYNCLTK